MKLPSALSTAGVLLLIGNASAFSGQMAASEYYTSAQLGYGQSITLTDYYTGSQYYAWLYGGFNGCVDKKCTVQYVFPSLRVASSRVFLASRQTDRQTVGNMDSD
jgi:hypothetical protein